MKVDGVIRERQDVKEKEKRLEEYKKLNNLEDDDCE